MITTHIFGGIGIWLKSMDCSTCHPNITFYSSNHHVVVHIWLIPFKKYTGMKWTAEHPKLPSFQPSNESTVKSWKLWQCVKLHLQCYVHVNNCCNGDRKKRVREKIKEKQCQRQIEVKNVEKRWVGFFLGLNWKYKPLSHEFPPAVKRHFQMKLGRC